MKIGDRVVVAIRDPARWAVGAAEALNGKRGVVEDLRPVDSIGCGGVLVRFDSPASPWRNWQTPPVGHWFALSEVQPEPAPLPIRRVCVSPDGGEAKILTLDAFLLANAEDAFACMAVGALKPGESISLGGGALVVVAL